MAGVVKLVRVVSAKGIQREKPLVEERKGAGAVQRAEQQRVDRRKWWLLYPLQGLDLTDEQLNLDGDALLGDATILSKRHVPELVERVVQLDYRYHAEAEDLVRKIQHEIVDDPDSFQTFVAVRRDDRAANQAENYEAAVIQAGRGRAYEVAGLLSLVVLLSRGFQQTCGLVEQLHSSTNSAVMLDLTGGDLRIHTAWNSSHSLLFGADAIRVSSHELGQLLQDAPYLGLTNAVKFNSPFHRSFRDVIRQTIVLLSSAVHAIIPSVQLLSAVTALELMLGRDTSTTNKILTPRLAALVGQWNIDANEYELDKIVQARNLYVHEGKPIEDSNLAWSAVELAIGCLLHYAALVSRGIFDHNPALIDYLDFVAEGDRMEHEYFGQEWGEAFQGLLRHDRQEPLFLTGEYEGEDDEDNDGDDD